MVFQQKKPSTGFWNLANMISIFRIILLPVFYFLLFGSEIMKLSAVFLCVLIFLLDNIDGLVARTMNLCTSIGAFLDIVCDRITEMFLWLVFLSMSLVPLWAPVIIIARGMVTDTIRVQAQIKGKEPYKMMSSRTGRFLVTSKLMRGLMGGSKMILFAVLTLYVAYGSPVFLQTSRILVPVVVAINLARGIPVIAEAKRYFD